MSAKLPKHIAIIMDGNGRWATSRGLERVAGHRAGLDTARKIAVFLASKGVEYITFFGFSTENWKRPRQEILALNNLLNEGLESYNKEFTSHNIRFKHIGRLDKLPAQTQSKIKQVIVETQDKTGSIVAVAFDYGSRDEIVQAASSLMEEGVKHGDITPEMLNKKLYTADMPDVDLLIRTGGEQRLSNFMLWQSAYAELFFSPTFWPDFAEEEMQRILDGYAQRERRFGAI